MKDIDEAQRWLKNSIGVLLEEDFEYQVISSGFLEGVGDYYKLDGANECILIKEKTKSYVDTSYWVCPDDEDPMLFDEWCECCSDEYMWTLKGDKYSIK